MRWTVRNAGVGPTATATWFDQLFWSSSTDLGMLIRTCITTIFDLTAWLVYAFYKVPEFVSINYFQVLMLLVLEHMHTVVF